MKQDDHDVRYPDPVAKTHPCLVDDYSQLSAYEHFKDHVFLGLVQLGLEGGL